MRVVRVDHTVWGAVLRARTLFLLPTSASASLGRSGRCRRLPPCITRRNYVDGLGTWNVRKIIGTAKREEVVGVFREGKFELLALTEAKSKGTGEVSCGVNGKYHHCWCPGDGKNWGRCGHPVERFVAQCSENLVVLALEFSGLNLSFLGLKFLWWWGMAPMREMVLERHGQDSWIV